MTTQSFTPATPGEGISVAIGIITFLSGVIVFLTFGTVNAVFDISLWNILLALF